MSATTQKVQDPGDSETLVEVAPPTFFESLVLPLE